MTVANRGRFLAAPVWAALAGIMGVVQGCAGSSPASSGATGPGRSTFSGGARRAAVETALASESGDVSIKVPT
jgi:hypothetical protein